MDATLNTFPPFQSMNSPRGWVLAAIVVLHASFFWLLSSGMGSRIVEVVRGPGKLVIIDSPPPIPQPPPQRILVDNRIQIPIDTPVPLPPPPIQVDDDLERQHTEVLERTPDAGLVGERNGGSMNAPVVVEPDIDPRVGLSEPLYPASEIRADHTGTVLVSVWVLENGRVGEVRLDQSSGWRKLDDSALREARRWRFKPGMRDGIATAMWKQIPVTFQLQTDRARR